MRDHEKLLVKVKTSDHIPGLDGIRAIAFLMVYFSHMGLGRSYTGGQGVAFFFFLSGYLITTLMRKESNSTGTISIFEFYVRRFFRIIPPLYVTVLLAILLHLARLDPALSFRGVVSAVLYYSNFYMLHHGGMGGLGATWSLSIEEHYYFAFPFIYLLTIRLGRKAQSRILAVICIAILPLKRIYMYTDTRVDLIFLGAILALTINPVFDAIPAWFRKRPRLYGTCGAVSALAVDHIPIVKDGLSYTLIGLSLFPVFWFVISYSHDRLTRWLESALLRTIGRWSYSLYLVHSIVIDTIKLTTHLSSTASSLLAIGPCLIFAWAVEKFVEKPSYRLRNFIITRIRKKRVHIVTDDAGAVASGAPYSWRKVPAKSVPAGMRQTDTEESWNDARTVVPAELGSEHVVAD